jgi:hypothetical protein
LRKLSNLTSQAVKRSLRTSRMSLVSRAMAFHWWLCDG